MGLLSADYNEIQQLTLEAIAACAKNQANRAIIGIKNKSASNLHFMAGDDNFMRT